MLDEIEPGQGRRGYQALITTLRQGPQAELYRQLEQMAEDAGTDRQKVGWEREAFLHNQQVDHLLTLDPDALTLELAEAADMGVSDYHTLVKICAARRGRNESDEAKLAALELELSSIGPPGASPLVGQALERLDKALRHLVNACAVEVHPATARTLAAQYVLARVLRELRADDPPAQPLMAG
jgi:hypothetical protein